MKKIGWFSGLLVRQPFPTRARCIAGGAAVAALLLGTAFAGAQVATPGTDMPATATQPVAPKGYTLHETIDLGGHMAGISGSGAMYDTMVNLHSGPRVLGETFELHALPGTKHMLVDSLSAFSNGWGGDPNNYARMDFYKGNLYDFSGTFRRDRQYFDYDLLGNPNIPSGQTIPIGSVSSPTGSYAWTQLKQSPFMYNTVRRMTDTHLTLLPLSKVSFRVGYSQNIFQGPSLTPSGYQIGGGRTSILLNEFQRNSTDDFMGGIDWKPVRDTKLTFEEQIDHYKNDSYFTLPSNGFRTVQEPDGTVATILTSYDSLTPSITCNKNSVGTLPTLSAPQTPGGLPVINPACNVVISYLRTAPTRILYPTEIFRFETTSLRNVAMNGDIRYTDAKMTLPNYSENFQGLSGTTRMTNYTATASAHRKVTAFDYGILWNATRNFSFSDQVTFSNVQQPGTAVLNSVTTLATPSTTGNENINYAGGLTTTQGPVGTAPIEGAPGVGTPQPGFFGQKLVTNDLTASWDGWAHGTIALTYRHRTHIIAEGLPHSDPLTYGETDGGTVTIHQNGGVLNITVRPSDQWNIDGSAEILYADNAFTPVSPRQLQHYRIHTLYRPKSWATLSGAYNDIELHNNTNNTGTAPLDGPLDHVAHTRVVGLGAELAPSEHYAVDLNYAYSGIYTATNICYLASATPALPGAATPSGTACPYPAGTKNRSGDYDFGPARDFMDAPTQSGSVAIIFTPVKRFKSDVGYDINSVNGSRFYNDARDVAGSLVSTYETPFVSVAWTVRPGWIWSAQYKFYGYGEGGPSGAPYCSTADPAPGTPTVPVVPCNDASLAGTQTGLTISPAGETAPRNFHANVVTLGMHYAF